MLTVVLVTILLILISYVYVRWLQLKKYWAKRRVPHTPPHPIFGSLSFLQKENPALWFRRMYQSYKEPYVGIWLFWRPSLLVNSPDIAKNILIKDHASFRNRLATTGTSDPIGRLNIFSADDPQWSAMRKRLSVLFTSSKLRGMQTLVTEKCKELVERIDIERKKPDPIDLRRVITDYTTDLIGTASFGVASDATLTGTSHVRAITEQFMTFSVFRGWAWCCAFFFPEMTDVFRFKLFPTESTENLRQMLRQMIAHRGGFENKVTEPRDLLDILIKIKQQNDQFPDIDMTEDMMLAQAAVFLQGGFDSTGSILAFAIYELAFCPEAQEKLIDELNQARNKHGENILDTNVLFQLTYLNCVIDETLRKYPIMSWIDRVAITDYKIDDNLVIEAGTPMVINSVGMHYDPELYPEPVRFNPDRFLPENVDNIKPMSYLPFGEGPRKCIGQRIGQSNIRHGLAAIVLHYDIKPLPTAPPPSEMELECKGLFIAPKHRLSVEFIPRNNM